MSVLDTLLNAIRLNDEDDGFLDDDLLDDEDDDFLDDDEDIKPRKSFFDRFQKKSSDDLDDLDDDDFDDEPEVKKAPKVSARASKPAASRVEVRQEKPSKSSKITPMRSSRSASSQPALEVCVIKPTSMEDTRDIADNLCAGATVILNLEGIDVELAQRIIDFTSGACYSREGTLQKVSSYIFVLGPSRVEITGDLQSILGGSSPSVRAGY